MIVLPLLLSFLKSAPREQERIQILTEQGSRWVNQLDGLTHYLDITDGMLSAQLAPSVLPLGAYLEHSSLSSLCAALNKDRLKRDLNHFTTAFVNRHYQSRYGKQSAEWLLSQLQQIKGDRADIQIEVFAHKDWPQPSLIARLQPKGKHSGVAMVLTAHQDSTASFMPKWMPAPGADDDGSGAMLVLEVFRVMSQANLQLDHPVEFMWFAAEEGGLKGSQAVARAYQQRGKQARFLHLDMIGYSSSKNAAHVGVITDNTTPELSEAVRSLAKLYADCPVIDTQCGYACSDHHSWLMAGYPVAALFESTFDKMSPHIHTERDTVDTIDFDHVLRFGRIALAFLTGY